MLYFAYGSNMDWPRMRERCRSAQFICKSILPDYELQFTRTSRHGHGTADIVPCKGSVVWGVVYHLTEADRRTLDTKEGVGIRAYQAQNITVQAEGDAARSLEVFTYVVCAKETPRPKPSVAYLQHLLDGADKWKLPDSYVKMLRTVETLPASDTEKAKALAREIASRVIQQCPTLWDDLNYRLADCQSVDVYGSMEHMDFLGAVNAEIKKLSDAERLLLQTHIRPNGDVNSSWTFADQITGEIFARAKRASARM